MSVVRIITVALHVQTRATRTGWQTHTLIVGPKRKPKGKCTDAQAKHTPI